MKKILVLIMIFFSTMLYSNEITKVIGASEKWVGATEPNCKGFYWQIAKEVFASSNIKLECIIAPYVRTIHMVESDKADFWVASYKHEEEFAIYPKHHFDADNVAALYNKTKNSINSIDDLKDKKIIWMRGYSYNDYIDIKLNFKEIDNRDGGIKMIESGRVDIMLDAKIELDNAIKKLKPKNLEIKIIKYLPLYMGFNNTSRGKQLAKIWDENLEKLHKNGRLKDIYNKAKYTNIYPFSKE